MGHPRTEALRVAPPDGRERAREGTLLHLLRCLICGGRIDVRPLHTVVRGEALRCSDCGEVYPVIGGCPSMLTRELRDALSRDAPDAAGTELETSRRTADAFAYEWEHFGDPQEEWELNFEGYMRPHSSEWFRDRLVLDVGAGSGRHSYHAHRLGARVVSVDVGGAVHVARRNLPPEVLVVQADAENLPFAEQTFDLVAAIGVLHHLGDPQRALRSIARYVKPGGYLQVYLYWVPPHAWHRAALRVVSRIRRVTTRMPKPLLRFASYPLAVVLFTAFVLPHRVLRDDPRFARVVEQLPLKAYADYPFRVCVNDQFDRFAAPLEWRFTEEEVREMLAGGGFVDIEVHAHHGWIGTGRRPPLAGL